MGSGSYTWKNIKIENQAEEIVQYNGEKIATAINGKSAMKPIITSVISTESEVEAPGTISVTIAINTDAPPYMLCYSLSDPDGQNLIGGCGSSNSEKIDDNVYNMKASYSIKHCNKAGTYKFDGISVRNYGYKNSDEWASPILINVTTPHCDATGKYCDITNATAEPNEINGNGTYTLNVFVNSSSEANWLDFSYFSPTNQNIYGGGGSWKFEKIDGIWVAKWELQVRIFYIITFKFFLIIFN